MRLYSSLRLVAIMRILGEFYQGPCRLPRRTSRLAALARALGLGACAVTVVGARTTYELDGELHLNEG